MKTIEERCEKYKFYSNPHLAAIESAKEQEAIDVENTIICLKNTITCLKEQKMAIIDRVFKALDNIYFANDDARKDAKKILKNAIERERK